MVNILYHHIYSTLCILGMGMITSIEPIPTAVGVNRTMEKSTPDIVDILNVLSDDKTLHLLRNIACAKCCSSDSLLRNTQLTHKQYYSRMPGVLKAGLVRKTKGRYCLTSLGKVFYYLQLTAQNALNLLRKFVIEND